MNVIFLFKRTFTLKDFELNHEPINLMDEIFTEEEWLPYLPSKTSPPRKDTTPDVLHPDEDAELHVPLMKSERNQTKTSTGNHSDVIRDETVSPNERKDNRHLLERDGANGTIFAIPKALLTNAAQQQRPRRTSRDDVCDRMFMIPKYDFLLTGRRSLDVFLDFSSVEVRSISVQKVHF